MPRLSKVRIEDARSAKTSWRHKTTHLERYKQYIEELSEEEAGKLTVKNEKESFAVRNRIRRSAEALGVNVKIKKVGNDLYFWKE